MLYGKKDMNKYKICKFVNGNGYEWYQVMKKGWFFWHYISAYKGGAPEFSPRKIPIIFDTIEHAKKHIQDEEVVNRTSQIKKVECFDYV